jgi:arsenate reductase
MKKIYYLHTCSTCQRILKEWNPSDDVEMREIKSNPIQPEELEEMKARAGSYEALFSRRAMKYKSMGLKDKNLSEDDYRNLILDEYTFLKRPVAIVNDEIFVGSAAKTVEAAKTALSS